MLATLATKTRRILHRDLRSSIIVPGFALPYPLVQSLSMTGRWFPCRASRKYGPLWIFEPAEPIVRGMSGSPIKATDGSAIGLVRAGSESENAEAGFGP